jgi:hypothetical protein
MNRSFAPNYLVISGNFRGKTERMPHNYNKQNALYSFACVDRLKFVATVVTEVLRLKVALAHDALEINRSPIPVFYLADGLSRHRGVLNVLAGSVLLFGCLRFTVGQPSLQAIENNHI